MSQFLIIRSVLLLSALSVLTACSSAGQRRGDTIGRVLPPSPNFTQPQARFRRDAPVYVPDSFDEYRPLEEYTPQQYGNAYAPPKDYRDPQSEVLVQPVPPVSYDDGERVIVEEIPARPLNRPLRPQVVKPVQRTPPLPRVRPEELDIDPFADVPDREIATVKPIGDLQTASEPPPRPQKSMSSAARSLLMAARVESSVGRHDSAINKIERALRIEPQSPGLWHELANLNYKRGRNSQAISLARKALNMASGNRAQAEKSLALMERVAGETGNAKVMGEVNEYKKLNL